jgi:hypothetical protein
MDRSIFFSWQTDRSAKEGRNFIEGALEVATKRIAQDLQVDEAIRETLLVDKDTKGVPGSPPIFQTILGKIDWASAFVADLTFTGTRADGRLTPNPNVLIEYGWALKALGYSQVLAVMNAAPGLPSRESLPFDLASLRFPITYDLRDAASESVRRAERDQLAKKLEIALRTVFESEEFKAKLPKEPESPPFSPKAPLNGRARFRSSSKPLGFARDPVNKAESPVSLVEGPAACLRVMPKFDSGRSWLNEDLRAKATPLSTLPLMQIPTNIGFLRNEDGCGYYRGYDVEANCIAYIFSSGELWIINAAIAGAPRYIAFEESPFTESLDYCASFLDGLGCARPYAWVVGIEGVQGRHFVSNRLGRTIGPCVSDVIEEEGIYGENDKAAGLLLPFFEKIFDKCGSRRPQPSP